MLTRGQLSIGYQVTKELSIYGGVAAVSTSNEQPAQLVYQIDPYRHSDDIAKSWVGSQLGIRYAL